MVLEVAESSNDLEMDPFDYIYLRQIVKLVNGSFVFVPDEMEFWLSGKKQNCPFKYGFQLTEADISNSIITSTPHTVTDRLRQSFDHTRSN